MAEVKETAALPQLRPLEAVVLVLSAPLRLTRAEQCAAALAPLAPLVATHPAQVADLREVEKAPEGRLVSAAKPSRELREAAQAAARIRAALG
jgi:hypothetical protein